MGFVLYEQKDAVGIVTINRPEALNALNSAVLDELDAVIDAVDLNTVRCLILTGAGEKSFVAGADIGEMSSLTKAEGEAFGKKGNDVFRKIETLPVPVIAAVNGFALGGGCEISMSCDIRICSENAVFGQPEVGLGITPGFGGTQRLARLVSPGMAKQLIYTARNIKADEAYRIGLVNKVVKAEKVYKSLTGTVDGTTIAYTAEQFGGEYLMAFAINPIALEDGETITITVQPYTTETVGGAKSTGVAYDVTYDADGNLVSQCASPVED